MVVPRFDRLATMGLFWPISRTFSGGRRPNIPILMYHAVRETRPAPRPYYDTNVSPQVFARQMQQLRAGGYRAVNLEQALNLLRNGDAEQKFVVITFDDGYRDFYQTAFPILAACEFTATVFLIAEKTSDRPACFKEKECLTWNEVRELRSKGISFGSHTVTHPVLKFLSIDEVYAELANSKKIIEDQIGAAVQSFSYPYAFPEANVIFTRQLRELLLKCGYENGVTTILGTAKFDSDPFFLPRLPMNSWDDAQFFRAKLEGGYDWLHKLQYLLKRTERLRQPRSDMAREQVATALIGSAKAKGNGKTVGV
jgi:peptidoglycan/xylan/chitin deacetylase (PgdA/CDA1 family)